MHKYENSHEIIVNDFMAIYIKNDESIAPIVLLGDYFNSLAVLTVAGKVCITSNLDLVFLMFTPNDDNSLTTF